MSLPSNSILIPPSKFHFNEEEKSTIKMPLWFALDKIQDPHNMGAILRSSWFYGIHGIIRTSKSCPINATCANISTGAAEILPIHSCKDLYSLIKNCNENGWQTVGTCSHTEIEENFHLLNLLIN